MCVYRRCFPGVVFSPKSGRLGLVGKSSTAGRWGIALVPIWLGACTHALIL